MPIYEIEQRKAEKALQLYCALPEGQVPHPDLQIVYRIEGNYAFVAERRPDWRDRSVVRDHEVAKMRFLIRDRKWRLYCRDRNLRWHRFTECPPSKDIGNLLEWVGEHPIFHG